jgi:hypothetical protein
MATRDCRLTLTRRLGEAREREVCTLVDLSYAGLRFRAPVRRSGFVKALIRWVRPLGYQECDAGAEFLEECKGCLLGPEEPYR